MLTLTPKLVTQYHVGIATADWLRDLEIHVSRAIKSHPEYHTSFGTGTVTSRYNEERFMGPLSLIKNDFDVNVDVSRRFVGKDRYEATVRYAPDSNMFQTLRENVETIETKRRDKHFHRIVTQFVKKIERGCQRHALNEFRCPWCDATIDVSFHSSGEKFAVSCPNHHFFRHEETASPPDWWRDAVTGGWLEINPTEQTDEQKLEKPG